jgi:hypothetical protein
MTAMNRSGRLGWSLAVVLLAGLVALWGVQSRRLGALRVENAGLRQASGELERLRAENREAQRLRVDRDELERLRKNNEELQKLRGHYVELKQLREDYEKLQADKQAVEQQLRQWQAAWSQQMQRPPPPVALPPVVAPVNRGAYLGVAIRGVSELRPEEAIPGVASGALVTQVLPNTPGALAGLKDGDVIAAIDGRPVATLQDVRNEMSAKNPGTAVSLTVVRAGRSTKLSVATSAWPQ